MKISDIENAPASLKEAKTFEADISIEGGRVIWFRGEWRGGEWRGGVWRGGEWRGGVWRGQASFSSRLTGESSVRRRELRAR